MTRQNQNSRSLSKHKVSERVHDRMVKRNAKKIDIILAGSSIDLDQMAELVANYQSLDTDQATAFTAADAAQKTYIDEYNVAALVASTTLDVQNVKITGDQTILGDKKFQTVSRASATATIGSEEERFWKSYTKSAIITEAIVEDLRASSNSIWLGDFTHMNDDGIRTRLQKRSNNIPTYLAGLGVDNDDFVAISKTPATATLEEIKTLALDNGGVDTLGIIFPPANIVNDFNNDSILDNIVITNSQGTDAQIRLQGDTAQLKFTNAAAGLRGLIYYAASDNTWNFDSMLSPTVKFGTFGNVVFQYTANNINLSSGKTLTYNGGTDIQAQITANASTSSSAVATETAARIAADTTLTNNLATEVSANNTDHSAATTDRAAIRTEFATADTTLTNNLATEVSANNTDHSAATTDRATIRTEFATADTTLTTAVNVEKGRIDTILASSTSNLDTFIELSNAFAAGDNTVAGTVTTLTNTHNTHKAAADTDRALIRSQQLVITDAITTALNSEISTTGGEITTLTNNLATEVSANNTDHSAATTDRAAIRTEFATADTTLTNAVALNTSKVSAGTFGIADGNTLRVNQGTGASDDRYARFTASGLESRTLANTRNDLDLYTTGEVDTALALRALAADARFTGNSGFGTTSPDTDSIATFHGEGKYGSNGVIAIQDNTPLSTGNGGGIQFKGIYNAGTGQTIYGSIRTQKDNATAGQYGASLELGTRASGSGDSAVGFTVNSDQTCSTAGDLDIGGTLKISGSAIDKDDVGLGNVDNTTDLLKVISTPTQTALDLKLNLSGGTLTGASPLVFEGATPDAYETTFTITDPTADRTITFPDSSGTVAFTGGGSSIAMDFETAITTIDTYDDAYALADNKSYVFDAVTAGNDSFFILPASSAIGTVINHFVHSGTAGKKGIYGVTEGSGDVIHESYKSVARTGHDGGSYSANASHWCPSFNNGHSQFTKILANVWCMEKGNWS